MHRKYRMVSAGLFVLPMLTTVCQAVEFVTVDDVGRIHSMGPNVINIITDQQKPLIADLDPRRVADGVQYQGLPPVAIKIEGTISPDTLGPGSYVRFEATLDARRRGTEEVAELTVFTPEKNTVFGASSSNLADLPGGDFGGDGPSGKRPKSKPFVAGEYFITGRLQSARKGSLSVAYPEAGGAQKIVRVRLAKDATVKLESNDLKFAAPGDKIRVKGHALKLPKFFATEVTITMSRGEDKKPARPVAPKQSGRAAGHGPQQPLEAEAAEGGPPGEEPAAKPVKGQVIKIN